VVFKRPRNPLEDPGFPLLCPPPHPRARINENLLDFRCLGGPLAAGRPIEKEALAARPPGPRMRQGPSPIMLSEEDV